MSKRPTKQKVMDAASILFFQNGFHGTSIRDIAEQAGTNVSLISYYFKSKQGLLEYVITTYYEAYLDCLEETVEKTRSHDAVIRLKTLIETIIQYKQTNHQLTSFIQRELSLDTVFVREMTVTYLAKENHFLSESFFPYIQSSSIKKADHSFFFMQLKGMLITPFVMQQHEWKNYIVGEGSETLFIQKYVKTIHHWLDYLLEFPRPE